MRSAARRDAFDKLRTSEFAGAVGRSGPRACSLGEISDALERAFGRYGTKPEPVRGIYGKARRDGRWRRRRRDAARSPSGSAASPASWSPRWARTATTAAPTWSPRAFTDLGFEVIPGPLFQTPREAAEMAVEHDVDVVGA